MLEVDTEVLRRRLEEDGEFRRGARLWTGSFAFQDEASCICIELQDGRLAGVTSAGGTPDVTITGPAAGWEKVFAAVPPPYYQDLMGGAVGRHGFTFSGDLTTLLAYYAAIQRAVVVAGQVSRMETV